MSHWQNVPPKLCLFQNRCVQIYDACRGDDAEENDDDDGEFYDEPDDSHVTQVKRSMYCILTQSRVM